VSAAHNICGQAYSLTVLTPIAEGHEADLADHLSQLPTGDQSPLAGVPGTHFARWVVIDDVIFEGPEQGERDHLQRPRLLFTSNFDGQLEPYLEALRTGLGDSADSIWGHCAGYPGTGDPDTFAAYFRHHQIDSSLFFAAYGERTVDEVKRSLAARAKLIAFALRAQGLPAAQLRSTFLEEFGS
jgi:hypothetical protein